MNKKKRIPKKISSKLLVSLVIGGALLFAVAVFFVFGGGDGGGTLQLGTPRLVVDQQKIDYGDVKFDTLKTFAVKVTNTGDGALRFKEAPYIQVMEGC